MAANPKQSCVLCAWRETCAKRFNEPTGGARCPDFSRDLKIKETVEKKEDEVKEEEFEEILPAGKSGRK